MAEEQVELLPLVSIVTFMVRQKKTYHPLSGAGGVGTVCADKDGTRGGTGLDSVSGGTRLDRQHVGSQNGHKILDFVFTLRRGWRRRGSFCGDDLRTTCILDI